MVGLAEWDVMVMVGELRSGSGSGPHEVRSASQATAET
jgi:hypothetical protein